jgi:hypothetical protein
MYDRKVEDFRHYLISHTNPSILSFKVAYMPERLVEQPILPHPYYLPYVVS